MIVITRSVFLPGLWYVARRTRVAVIKIYQIHDEKPNLRTNLATRSMQGDIKWTIEKPRCT